MEMSKYNDHGWTLDWIEPVCAWYMCFQAVAIVGKKIAPDQISKDERKHWKWQVMLGLSINDVTFSGLLGSKTNK